MHGFMMYLMCPSDTQKVRIICSETLKPVMYKPVVEDEINNSVNGYACSDPESEIRLCPSNPHQIHGQKRKKQTENIIQFKPP